jgi:hypothetical protein
MARITFAIPFHSNLALLEKAVESVLAQSLTDWELIISDDHSPEDGAARIPEKYKDARIRYARNDTNLGMAGNWNRGLDLAQSELVTLLHADDFLLPSYADVMVAAAGRHPDATAFFCDVSIVDGGDRPVLSVPDLYKKLLWPHRKGALILAGEGGLRALMKGDFIMCPTLCYRKSKLGALRFSETWKMVLDLDLEARLLLRGDTLIGVTDKAYAYRRHSDNSSLKYTQSLLRFREEIAIFREIGARARDKGWARVAAIAARKRIIKLHLLYCIFRDVLTLRLPLAAAKGRFLIKEVIPG